MDTKWKRNRAPHQRAALRVAVSWAGIPLPAEDVVLEREEQGADPGTDAGQPLHHHPNLVHGDLWEH